METHIYPAFIALGALILEFTELNASVQVAVTALTTRVSVASIRLYAYEYIVVAIVSALIHLATSTTYDYNNQGDKC